MNLADPKRSLVGQSRFENGGFERFRGYPDQYHLLESGESLGASGSPRYLTAGRDANESAESLGAL